MTGTELISSMDLVKLVSDETEGKRYLSALFFEILSCSIDYIALLMTKLSNGFIIYHFLFRLMHLFLQEKYPYSILYQNIHKTKNRFIDILSAVKSGAQNSKWHRC